MLKLQIKKSTPLATLLKLGAECNRCGICCKFGAGFLTKEDISRISEYLEMEEKEFIKKCLTPVKKFNTTMYRPKLGKKSRKDAYGSCIFFSKEDGCIIHEVKPINCRIASCNQYAEDAIAWFTLNYFVNPDDAESIRQWKLYLESGGKTIPGGGLWELVPDRERLKKILSYEIL